MREYNDPFPRALITRKNNQSRRQNKLVLYLLLLIVFLWTAGVPFLFFFMHFAENILLSVKVDVIWQPFTLRLIQPQKRDNISIGYRGNRAGNRPETKLSSFFSRSTSIMIKTYVCCSECIFWVVPINLDDDLVFSYIISITKILWKQALTCIILVLQYFGDICGTREYRLNLDHPSSAWRRDCSFQRKRQTVSFHSTKFYSCKRGCLI